MLIAAHVIAFADDAERARAFFADVLELPCVDSGGGWLIFAMPPTELAVHPGAGWGEREGGHRLFLVCDDIERTVAELSDKGVEFTDEITTEEWGLVTTLNVPGHGEIGLYQPTHPSPLEGVGIE
jgi:catechol 2,3-dioxygenase-like lactoylglutathione lyase family enzyme